MKNNEIQYIEFLSSDFGKVKEFYGAAFGWKFTDYGAEYIAFEGECVSGGFGLGEVVRGSILVILLTDNLEESLQSVKDAGGKIIQEIFSFPGGRRFHFADLEGNELAVWCKE